LPREGLVRVYLPVSRMILFCCMIQNYVFGYSIAFCLACILRTMLCSAFYYVNCNTYFLIGCQFKYFCIVSLHGPTFVLFGVLILGSAVLSCTYCKPMGMFVLYKLRSAVCVFEGSCFYSIIFFTFVIVFYPSMLSFLIQLLLLFYFLFFSYPAWITCPPQDPNIRSSAAQRTESRFVPVLGSTPSAATLLGSYPKAHSNYPSFAPV
jgi:hypothetical protein